MAVRDQHVGVEVTVEAGEIFIARIAKETYRALDLRLGQEVSLVFTAEAVRLS
jgi:hypothetical protein